ncbi:putative ABC transporter solute-binding protein YclQ [Brevibacillus reuszeri]|uniref:ABC transporter n=1 Tax=Brevibacillus reuszeri TaxID=54915 RepID=A0A0K9YTU1_9BACL|nr:siderophore ABC transporter substrate-binding protein [Brevibacillus reuszeri]KNB71615.1 ABC transporter [Brevibacillus reuszeri]MED1855565.1 siderophore ABC transporter substrate-binding protein [Brevibacillus reuszeri]GED67283.1 putative ABC transporter solute-binding protein YclQ [Brevibacillus reuszeri]
MNKKFIMLFMAVLLAVFTAACGSNSAAPATQTSGAGASTDATKAPEAAKESEEITIKHKLGEAKLKKNPQTVVAFDYGVLDSLDKLGIEVTGVAQSSVPPYLEKFKDAKYKNIGSLKEPDFEKINAMKPDVIFISGRQQDAYEELNKIAPTIFLGVDTSKYMESFTENMKTLGTIFGKEAQVDEELAKINDSIKQLNEKATASGKNALIILANEGKISAYSAGSRFGILHDVFGFTPVDKNIEVSTHGQSVSFEYVAEKDPDYLFVVDRDGAIATNKDAVSPAKKVIENDLIKNTKAFKNGNIIYLDSNYWYLSGGGLVSTANMADEVLKDIK